MKLLGALFICFSLVFASIPITSHAVHPLQTELEATMICLCGCGQTIKDCPHQNCGYAIPARKKIKDHIEEGKTKAEIFDIFVAKYGEEALATPTKKGFNLIGYIMPFVALLLAGLLIMIIIRKWIAKGIRDEEDTLTMTKNDFGSDIDKQIEKELEEMD